MNKVIVTIQGANYTMVGEKSEKEMLTIANYVNSEMEKLKESAPNLGSLKISILTSLNLADLLFECSSENEDLLNEIDKLKEQLGQPNEEIEAQVAELKNILSTKGFENALVYISEGKVNVVVSEEKLDESDAAKIFDLVAEQADVKYENIKLMNNNKN